MGWRVALRRGLISRRITLLLLLLRGWATRTTSDLRAGQVERSRSRSRAWTLEVRRRSCSRILRLFLLLRRRLLRSPRVEPLRFLLVGWLRRISLGLDIRIALGNLWPHGILLVVWLRWVRHG